MNYERPDLLDRLAGAYVLGTLRGGARRRFAQLIAQRPAVRAAVQTWEQRLAPLAQSVPPVTPPARVWAAIDARTASRARDRAGVERDARGWRAWLRPALGVALGAALTVGLVRFEPGLLMSLDRLAQREQALPQSYVGLLTDAQNQPTLLISSTRHGTRVSVKFLRPVAVPAGQVIQVWALPKDGAPFPLGVAPLAAPPGSTQFELAASSETLLSTVPRLAVSFEPAPVTTAPAAGAAAPTFVLAGFCVKLW